MDNETLKRIRAYTITDLELEFTRETGSLRHSLNYRTGKPVTFNNWCIEKLLEYKCKDLSNKQSNNIKE